MTTSELSVLNRLNLSLAELFAEHFPDDSFAARMHNSDFLREFTLLDILLQPEVTWRQLALNRTGGSLLQAKIWECLETIMMTDFGDAWRRSVKAEAEGRTLSTGLSAQFATVSEYWRPKASKGSEQVINFGTYKSRLERRAASDAAPWTRR